MRTSKGRKVQRIAEAFKKKGDYFIPVLIVTFTALAVNLIWIPLLGKAAAGAILGITMIVTGLGTLRWLKIRIFEFPWEKKGFKVSGFGFVAAGTLLLINSAILTLVY